MSSAARVLVVDDDPTVSEVVHSYLDRAGLQVTRAADGVTALDVARRTRPDLVVLDLMLPGMSGLDVCRRLREVRPDVAVVMLTALGEESDRIVGLETGADDYLVKPFSVGELLARVRALVRRARARPVRSATIEIGSIRLSPETREVTCAGSPVALTSVEFSFLELLMESAGRIVSRDEISAALFQRETSPFDRSIDVHISNLRRKLDGATRLRGESVIRTIRGVGYLFASPK
jgi:DNA-binding response OmpR family regulator